MKRNIRKTKINVETLANVYHVFLNNINLFYILSLKLNKDKGRTMPFLDGIGLPLCALDEKLQYNHMRCGP